MGVNIFLDDGNKAADALLRYGSAEGVGRSAGAPFDTESGNTRVKRAS